MSKSIRILLACLLLAGAGLGALTGVTKVQPTSESDSHRAAGDGLTNVAPLAGHAHPMGALSLLPPEMRGKGARTEEAYLFSVANPEVAQTVPCYCGCVGLGHLSSYDCYVAEAQPGSAIAYDAHAMNCGVCVDITQDTMRLLDEGRSPPEIRAFIDATYAIYGPPTPLHESDHSS